MKDKINTFVNYLLIGVIGFLPIALVFQIIVYVERFLKDFVLLVHGRYDNPLVTIALFTSAVVLLAYLGKMLKSDRAHLYVLPGIFYPSYSCHRQYLSDHAQVVTVISDHRRASNPKNCLCGISERRYVGSRLCDQSYWRLLYLVYSNFTESYLWVHGYG